MHPKEELSKVELEIAVPGAKREPVTIPGYLVDVIVLNRGEKAGQDVKIPIPRVQKLRLTEGSEKAIFGDLNPWRDACLPSLFPPSFYDDEMAYIDEEQVKIYNARVTTKLRDPALIEAKQIKPGIVKVKRSGWDVLLRNV